MPMSSLSEKFVRWCFNCLEDLLPKAETSDCCTLSRVLLIRRGLDIDGGCSVCNQAHKSVLHLFLDCNFARECWRRELAAALELNSVVWTGAGQPAHVLLGAASNRFMSWQQGQTRLHTTVPTSTGTWVRPPHGFLKCNSDAALQASSPVTGASWIVRDNLGTVVNACQLALHGGHDPRVAEALSFREALSWVKGKDFHHVIFETDSVVLFQAMNKRQGDSSYFSQVVSDCKVLLNEVDACSVSFARRSANSIWTPAYNKCLFCD
ncbi:uncharacterized protein LOC119370066 [Jatropha curcas]|uniref:uncharacterized protein LOC119370066 n=1 Tax=Jatropha curcas TaxID=180498 RepID=UPI001894D1A2|nr:uncharacterized protein LOC119370066 [Jatropha curcas]